MTNIYPDNCLPWQLSTLTTVYPDNFLPWQVPTLTFSYYNLIINFSPVLMFARSGIRNLSHCNFISCSSFLTSLYFLDNTTQHSHDREISLSHSFPHFLYHSLPPPLDRHSFTHFIWPPHIQGFPHLYAPLVKHSFTYFIHPNLLYAVFLTLFTPPPFIHSFLTLYTLRLLYCAELNLCILNCWHNL